MPYGIQHLQQSTKQNPAKSYYTNQIFRQSCILLQYLKLVSLIWYWGQSQDASDIDRKKLYISLHFMVPHWSILTYAHRLTSKTMSQTDEQKWKWQKIQYPWFPKLYFVLPNDEKGDSHSCQNRKRKRDMERDTKMWYIAPKNMRNMTLRHFKKDSKEISRLLYKNYCETYRKMNYEIIMIPLLIDDNAYIKLTWK